MELASAQVIGAGLAAIGVGAAAAGVGYVFGNFVVRGLEAGGGGYAISILCFFFVAFINALELLVGAIQAYVFALLTSLYINDAVNLH